MSGDPRSAGDLIGHDAAERAFLSAWESGRLHHAWLIAGPEGIGKATFAYRIARFLLAGAPAAEPEPAGFGFDFGAPAPPALSPPAPGLSIPADHPVARRIAAGAHPDLHVVARRADDRGRLRSEIVVDDVRRLGEALHRTPAEGGWRVVIVDAVDELNTEGANALLKLLEEPPRQSILLLVSHNPGRLLPTIRSRCRRLVLQPLGEADMRAALARLSPDLAPAEAAVLARLGEGSPGLALRLARDGGLAVLEEMVGLLGTLPALDGRRLHELADRTAQPRTEGPYRVLMHLLPWWLARLARRRAGGPADAALVPDEDGVVARLVRAGSADGWLDAREKILRLADRADAVHLDRRQVVLDVFLMLQAAAR